MTEPAHILIIDDDRRIRELLSRFLAGHGFRTSNVANAREAREHMRGLAFDLLVLDVMMPGEDGVNFAAALRAAGENVPVLMLSARTDATDRIRGLAAGSDDYLAKPFEPEELLLRVRSLLRRRERASPEIAAAAFGEYAFDVGTGELTKGAERVRLTSRERDILRILARNAGLPVSRNQLSTAGAEDAARAVDVQINRLRQKLEADPANPAFLQAVRGEGYTLLADLRRA